MKKLLGIALLTILVTLAALSLMGASGSSTFTSGPVALSADLQDVPTSPTNLTSTDTYIYQMTIVNGTAGAITLSVQDRAASPQYLLNVTIPANTTYVLGFPEGQKMKGGITWSAGGAGLDVGFRAKRI